MELLALGYNCQKNDIQDYYLFNRWQYSSSFIWRINVNAIIGQTQLLDDWTRLYICIYIIDIDEYMYEK